MSFTFILNSVFNDQSKTSSNTLTIVSGFNISAGNNPMIVLTVASDNVVTTDGNTNTHTSMSDSVGNIYTKVREFTNGQGSAGAGVTVSVWYSVMTVNLATSTILTVNFSNSITAKAVCSALFSKTARATVDVASSIDLANDGADPGSLTLSGLVSREYVFIRAQGHERPAGDTLTGDSGYTLMNGAGTSGGSAVTNMSVIFEAVIKTATSETTDPSWSNVADEASIMAALYEVLPTIPNKIFNYNQAVNRASTY